MCPSNNSTSICCGLYIVATPIGNLSDISLRAIEVLQNCDLILCEDTRVSRTLLAAHDIKTPLKPYHDHNADAVRPEIISGLKKGQTIALISDAGTPLVSDPGYKLVQSAHEQGIKVIPIPGPSAFLAGLSASGLPTDKFIFLGFLPAKKTQAKSVLEEYLPLKATQIYYETPKRIEKTLQLLDVLCPERSVVIARELTKLYEEIIRGTAGHILTQLKEREAPLKGEIVLLVSPAKEQGQLDDAALEEILRKALKTESVSTAAKNISNIYSLPRKRVYEMALKLSKS